MIMGKKTPKKIALKLHEQGMGVLIAPRESEKCTKRTQESSNSPAHASRTCSVMGLCKMTISTKSKASPGTKETSSNGYLGDILCPMAVPGCFCLVVAGNGNT